MKFEKLLEVLGKETVTELDALGDADLNLAVVIASKAIKGAVDELEANTSFQELKENLKAVSAGMREVKKRQNAVIQYCLHRMEEKGKG